jgi:signal transduction histidine kinase
VIQANAHRALIDLREVLGLLRNGADGSESRGPERPQPTLRDVPDLVAEARAAGMEVTLSDQVRDVDAAPDTAGRHAYRMIQEGLTNARRHAPDTPVEVRLSGAPNEGIRLEVRNPLRVGARGATGGSGLGLVGLAERATLSGGRLEHETTDDSQFVVRAWLPWPE